MCRHWESNFEGAICFLHDRARDAHGLRDAPPPVDFEKDFLQEETKYEPNIGKDYWLTRLRPDGIERGISSDAYYHVTLDDNRSGYISAFQSVAFELNYRR